MVVLSAEQAAKLLGERKAILEIKAERGPTERLRRYAKTVELPQLADAFRRLRQGTYGECCDCGEAIEPRRLAAIPEVPECKACEDARTVRKDRKG